MNDGEMIVFCEKVGGPIWAEAQALLEGLLGLRAQSLLQRRRNVESDFRVR